ncbi:MAG: enzyme of heme biosynthesis [Alistipes sp.]|nr:enzyme of heme biosynthesis [Alistipes sp.]
MENLFRKLTLTLAVTVCAIAAYGQQDFGPKWGADPAEREDNVKKYNFFRDAYNNKEYDEALTYLPELLEKAPEGTQNLYIYGINIYKDKILKSTSLADKNSYVDELMKLYDMRSQYFGSDPQRGTPYILANKANDYASFKPADRENVIRYYQEALEANGESAEPDFVILYFNELTNDYKDDLIEADEYMAEYDKLEALFNLPHNSGAAGQKNTLEALFISSGAANCENIERLFADRVNNDPDVETLEKAVMLLARGKCDSDFYGIVGDKLYAQKPTTWLAMNLADYYDAKGEATRSLEYLNAAIANEDDPEQRLNLAIRISGSELEAGNARSAADFARQAINQNPESGLAYFFLGQAYAVGANQCSGFDRQAAYWVVYDTLAKAKSLLGNDTSQVGNIDSQMARIRANFPTQEECFFRGLENGQSYTVRCGWVGGSTTVRYR